MPNRQADCEIDDAKGDGDIQRQEDKRNEGE
jgi:hypothetical protein